VLPVLTYAVTGLSVALMALAGWYAKKDRLIDDWMLGLAALIELGVLVQLVRGLSGLNHVPGDSEKATFAAYLITLPFIPFGTAFLAIKEKSRWAMAAIAVGAFAVAVMVLRLQQIWDLGG
jgi:hypothetical protein